MNSRILVRVINSRVWSPVLSIGDFANRISALRMRIIFGEPVGWGDLLKSPKAISAELVESLHREVA